MDPPICNPPGLYKTWRVFQGCRLVSIPKGLNPGRAGQAGRTSSMIINTSCLMKDNSSYRCTNYSRRKKFRRNFDRMSHMACPRASRRIEFRRPTPTPTCQLQDA